MKTDEHLNKSAVKDDGVAKKGKPKSPKYLTKLKQIPKVIRPARRPITIKKPFQPITSGIQYKIIGMG